MAIKAEMQENNLTLLCQIIATHHTSGHLDLSFDPALIAQQKNDIEKARQDQRADEINIS